MDARRYILESRCGDDVQKRLESHRCKVLLATQANNMRRQQMMASRSTLKLPRLRRNTLACPHTRLTMAQYGTVG